MERDWRGEGLLRSMGGCDQSPGRQEAGRSELRPMGAAKWSCVRGLSLPVWRVWACLCDHPEELGRVSALGVSTENQHPLGQVFWLLACRKSAFLNIFITAMWILLISHEEFFFFKWDIFILFSVLLRISLFSSCFDNLLENSCPFC